ncbi:MAG TPA: agmatine deiminase family protein [Flavitalea sp.]|nr:agmatine deiminase family protein [Flavitalea sp.]
MAPAQTPYELGYYFPAEFVLHEATWLSWPHKEASWPGKINAIYPYYARFVREVAAGERVRINVNDHSMKQSAVDWLTRAGAPLENIDFFFHPTNDAWCRDHGPAFLVKPGAAAPKVIVDWNYNAWGGKYPPYDLDDVIPTLVGREFGIPVYHPGIIMEGGAVEFNGRGSLITSESCLLNPNRNPHLGRKEIEHYLLHYYGAEQVLWIPDGIAGDDTDGHVDDTVRFVNEDTVLSVAEPNRNDENHEPLKKNLQALRSMRLLNGKQLNVVELPMPDPVVYEGQRLPASYANFYICNVAVIVPVFRCAKDDQALQIIQSCFPDRQVIGIDSTEIIWGLGSFHCLSQQEPQA